MQTLICEVCLKSDLLCALCQEKLEKGEINKVDIDISKFLFNLSNKVKSLRDVKIKKVIDSGVLLIIAGIGDGAKLVGKKGYVVKALAKKFKKPIRVLEEATDFRKFVEDLISPSTLSGINTVYSSDGKSYKIRIPTTQKSRLTISPENFSEIIENIYNKKAELVFEY